MAVRDVVQAAAGNAGGDKLYIEDVFSTYLYTGNGSTQTITNGIDLAGEGGMTWLKARDTTTFNSVFDTNRGGDNRLVTNITNAQSTYSGNVTSFNSNGFSLGDNNYTNQNNFNYASWTFRKAPQFFTAVTYTGNGVAGRAISHNLDSVPGSMIVKSTSIAEGWAVYHRSEGNTKFAGLDDTARFTVELDRWNNTTPTSTVFTVGNGAKTNASGEAYVAYLFAHDAGGFGDDGQQNVISCGSYVGNSSSTGPVVNLGWEPQWVMVKNASSTGDWSIFDNMRGMPATANATQRLKPNTADTESAIGGFYPTATGFEIKDTTPSINASPDTFIYIAIRRGPMKTPESGTEVFAPVQYTTSPEGFITGFPVDFGIAGNKGGTDKWYWQSRLQGAVLLNSASTAAEVGSGSAKFDMMNGYGTGFSTAYWANAFRRAPGFFDVVAYTGDDTSSKDISHNLGVAPEMMFLKARGAAASWIGYHKDIGNTKAIYLNSSNAATTASSGWWNNTTPTDTVFTVGANPNQTSWGGVIAYLFATCPGVSKVGSYTGTGATQAIDCGFSAGARFVLIKRTDSTGDWYVWDTARGIVSGNDPYLLLNSTAAEVTSTDYIDPSAAGFEISSTAPAAINASGGSYIFLAIA